MPGDITVGAVHQMACFMQRYYKENVSIILDEYDTPMQGSWISGYWNKTASFFNATFKTNLNNNVRKMNTFMNKVALNTFSSFDSGNKPSEQTEPERFYHGFVLGIVVNMADPYVVRSNRESGYGRYDVMLEPVDKNGTVK